MKIKVHAQRKFAQGAFIPPSASANPVERKVDVTPSKEENKHVYYNRMSAVSLLDIVAFQNMHSHTEPVVLLERLEEIQETMSQTAIDADAYAGPVKNSAPNGTTNHSKTKPARPLRYIRPKRTMGLNQRAQRPQNMHLRSRLGSSFKPKSRAVKKKCREKPKVAVRPMRRRRVPSPAESYDLDDDKPLTYIAQVLRRTVALRSDRNLRKRRGEDLATTSKRRARITMPTRPQKPTKPSVQTATSKLDSSVSDSDDNDNGPTNGPTKAKQSNTPKSSPSSTNGFKINEGAGTSKQAHPASLSREIGNRQNHRLTALRNTSRARLMIPKEEVDLRRASQARMPRGNHDLNKLNRTCPYVKSKGLEFRGSTRACRKINLTNKSDPWPQSIQNIDVRPSKETKTMTQSNKLGVKNTAQAESTTENNGIELKNSIQDETTSKNYVLDCVTKLQAITGQNKDKEAEHSTRGTSSCLNNGLKLRSSWRAQPKSQNNELKHSNSSQILPSNKINNPEHKSSSQPPPPSQNNETTFKSTSLAVPTIQSNHLSDTASSQVLTSNLNNNLKLRSSRSQPTVTSNDFSKSISQTTNPHDDLTLQSTKQTQPTNQHSLDLDDQTFQSSTLTPPTTNLDPNSCATTQPTGQNNDLKLRSSRSKSPSQRNLDLGRRLRPQPTIQNKYHEHKSNPQTIEPVVISKNDNLESKSDSQIQPTPQNNLGSSSRAQPETGDNILGFDNAQIQATTQNNEFSQKIITHAEPNTHNNERNEQGSAQEQRNQPTAQNNRIQRGSSQGQPIRLNNDLRNRSQAHSTRRLNDQSRRSSLLNQPSIRNNHTHRGGSTRAPPLPRNPLEFDPSFSHLPLPRLNINGNIGRLAMQDPDIRNNLLDQLMISNDNLDLIVNARPLSAIQNYDWNFGGTRSQQSSQNFGIRSNIRPRPTIRNDDHQQTPNSRAELTIRNDLGLGGLSQTLPAVRNVDAELGANSTRQRSNDRAVPTSQPSVQNDDGTKARAPPSSLNVQAESSPPGESSRSRLTYRHDVNYLNTGWRSTFRNHTYNRPRSTLLNDEIRPRSRPHNNKHHFRVPLQHMRDQAKYWNMDTNGSERTREQQLKAESLAAANRAARAERMATVAADRERAMTLDEALRECVLTAQSVTAEEVKPYHEQEEELAVAERSAQKRLSEESGMQRRQAIAARQQQLAESSPQSRRIARRISNTDTGVNGRHWSIEKGRTLSPKRAAPDTEPGPSKQRRKKRTSSPGDPETDTSNRTPESEPELRKEPQPDPELGSSKVRRKKATTPEDSRPDVRSPDSSAEPDPGPSKRRRRNTLLGGLLKQSRLRAFESHTEVTPRKSPVLDLSASEPQERPSEPSEAKPKANEGTPETSKMWMSSYLAPDKEPAAKEGDIVIPAELFAVYSPPPNPSAWQDDIMLNHAEQEVPHFKVPRIPAAKKPKVQGNERNDPQASSSTEEMPIIVLDEDEPTQQDVPSTNPMGNLHFGYGNNLAEALIQPLNTCLSKHYATVRSIVLATDSELVGRCGHCIYCTRLEKIRKLSKLVLSQRKPAPATNEVYDFDADREDSHENTRLYNFRQNRQPKLPEPTTSRQDAPKNPVYLDVLPPQNQHIIEITSVQMANQTKPMLRARLIRKTDANLENEFSLIEHENLLDQLLEIKIANSDQTSKKAAPVEMEEAVAGPSNAEPVQVDITDSADDVDLNYETDDSTEFLARLQTRLNTRKKTEQTSLRAKAVEKPALKKPGRAEAKKVEPVKKGKALRKSSVETMRVEMPRDYISGNFEYCFREAPIFYPTEEEFLDPLAYFEKIYPMASHFGLCKVVAPSGFKPKCTISDDVRFNVANQYISRLYCRWGAASKEMCAIKAYLAEQKVFFTRPPLIDGIELNLPKLYRTVQRHGGLKKVIEKKRWARVAEEMRFPRGPRSAKRIDQLYVKHLLPYDTLSSAERRELMDSVEHSWNRNYKKMLNRASNPLHRQKRLMGESDSSDEMDTDEDANLAYALAEAEDCVVTGRCMKLSVFKKVASNAIRTLFPNTEQPTPQEVEQEYWTLVSGAAEHVCVNAASIDTGEEGYGFTRAKQDPYSRHPWNLKMFSQNDGNVLRSLGPVLGVTVPTLHLGMVCATSCWHRDPHGLPWVEYMHHGPPKIWYGIPNELSGDFREAVENLCPTSCQNKSIWLPSDITMIPPHLLHAANVPLSRVVQKPGEFIIVCPKAYSSSIATGYTVSESVYFAPTQWLSDVSAVFQELRASCEPTMFSLSQLLLAVCSDARSPTPVLASVRRALREAVASELARRDSIAEYGVQMAAPEPNRASCSQARKRPAGAWNVREQDECEICRTTLYLSKVTGLTSKRSSFCLEHALMLLQKDKNHYALDVSGVVTTIFVFRAELENAVLRVEKRLQA